MKQLLSLSKKIPDRIFMMLLPWLGIVLGVILTAFLWLNDSQQTYASLRWISYAGIMGMGLYLLIHTSRRRAFTLLALFASVAIAYLFPALLGPACNGIPKALARPLYGGPCGRDCNLGCCIGNQCSQCPQEDPPPPPIIRPPTILGELNCALPGNNNWCKSNAQLALTVSDPRGYALTISGVMGGMPISCNGSCTVNLPEGSGTAAYTVTAAASGKSASGSTAWWYDPHPPTIFVSTTGNQAQNGWFSTTVDLSATASDAISGLDGSISMSFDGGTTWEPGPRALDDRIYDVLFRASDRAGNSTTSQMSLKIDTLPPVISLSEAGRLGQAGWYVSAATISAAVSDNLSGVVLVQYRVNGGGWQDGDSVTVGEGIYTIEFQVFDMAGNKAQITSRKIYVDALPPAYTFNATLNGAVLADIVPLTGTVSDETSGLHRIEFSLDAATWSPVSFADTRWSFLWDSSTFDNGNHDLFLRAIDVAGNQGEPIRISVILDNDPPYVKLAETWNIWESGDLAVFANIIPLESIRIVVHDPILRFADQVIYNKLPAPPVVVWDRVIGPASAPPGTYTVTVEVCDIYALCSMDTGTILIPDSPAPELVPTQPVEPQRWWSLPVTIPRLPEPEQPSAVPAVVVPIQENIPIAPSFPIWTMVVVSAFLLSFALLLVLDPRPKAWRSLTQRLAKSMMSN